MGSISLSLSPTILSLNLIEQPTIINV